MRESSVFNLGISMAKITTRVPTTTASSTMMVDTTVTKL
jgi:hypothetical protein